MLSKGAKIEFVMKIAGHGNIHTTLNHYARSDQFPVRDAIALL